MKFWQFCGAFFIDFYFQGIEKKTPQNPLKIDKCKKYYSTVTDIDTFSP